MCQWSSLKGIQDVVSYCLGIVPYSNGKISQVQRDARPIADALEQGHISLPGGEAGRYSEFTPIYA